jgi:hypothetical protein
MQKKDVFASYRDRRPVIESAELPQPAPAAFPLGEAGSDVALAPLLCAGLIGWRSLVIVSDGKKLGHYGFGAAAYILAQVAKWQGRSVFAFTRPGMSPPRPSPRGSAPPAAQQWTQSRRSWNTPFDGIARRSPLSCRISACATAAERPPNSPHARGPMPVLAQGHRHLTV